MARDRQRAKQRKQRREPAQPSRGQGGPLTPDRDHLHRENVPGPWEHGGEVDEVEATIVAGADGQAEKDPDAVERAAAGPDAPPREDGAPAAQDAGPAGKDDAPPGEDARAATEDAAPAGEDAGAATEDAGPAAERAGAATEDAGPAAERAGAATEDAGPAAAQQPPHDASAPAGATAPPRPTAAAAPRGGARFLQFLRAVSAELQRVQWPDRRQVGQATMVVLGFLLIAGAFLGLADFVAQSLVDFIL